MARDLLVVTGGAAIVDAAGEQAQTGRCVEGMLSQSEGAVEPIAHIVVRTGAMDRFSALRADFAPEGVDVIWDRRCGERRRSAAEGSPAAERRRQDRRGPIPASWTLLDFIVVPVRTYPS